MSAWDYSEWGTRLVATAEAVKSGITKAGQKGILLATAVGAPTLIKVVKEGTVTPSTYWQGFWGQEK